MDAAGHLSVWTVVLRLSVAALCGAIVGFDREVEGHDAGIRTHLLLAVGSALFGVVSVGAFTMFFAQRNDSNFTVDPSRIASYVAAGVGFLGAGAIVKRDDRVRGLTTAASIWVVAAVGLAAGLGFWSGALTATVITFIALVAERPLKALARRLQRQHPSSDRTS